MKQCLPGIFLLTAAPPLISTTFLITQHHCLPCGPAPSRPCSAPTTSLASWASRWSWTQTASGAACPAPSLKTSRWGGGWLDECGWVGGEVGGLGCVPVESKRLAGWLLLHLYCCRHIQAAVCLPRLPLRSVLISCLLPPCSFFLHPPAAVQKLQERQGVQNELPLRHAQRVGGGEQHQRPVRGGWVGGWVGGVGFGVGFVCEG